MGFGQAETSECEAQQLGALALMGERNWRTSLREQQNLGSG